MAKESSLSVNKQDEPPGIEDVVDLSFSTEAVQGGVESPLYKETVIQFMIILSGLEDLQSDLNSVTNAQLGKRDADYISLLFERNMSITLALVRMLDGKCFDSLNEAKPIRRPGLMPFKR